MIWSKLLTLLNNAEVECILLSGTVTFCDPESMLQSLNTEFCEGK